MGKRRGWTWKKFSGTDVASLRTRWTAGVVLFGSFFLGLWMLATDRASDRAFLEREQARLEAVASSAAVVIDGDRLAEEGTSDDALDRMVVRLAASQGLSASVSVLAPKDGNLRVLAASLPVEGERPITTVAGDENLERMMSGESVLFSRVDGGHLVAFAPVHTTDHRIAALVRVEGSIERPELDRSLSRAGLSVVGLIVLFILTRVTDSFAARHVSTLSRIASGEGPGKLGRFTSREVLELAEAMEHPAAPSAPATATRRAPLQPPPAARQVAPPEPAPATPPALSFSPVNLVQNIIAPHRAKAEARGTNLTITAGNRVPERLDVDPAPIHEALDILLRNAVQSTRKGSVRVRIATDPSGSGEGELLRFDVVDEGCGIGLAQQKELAKAIEAATRRATAGIGSAPKSGLARAAYLAAGLGGRLGFESQQGSGSRFWITVRMAPV